MMALEHSAEIDTIIGRIDKGIARCLRSDLEGRPLHNICLQLEAALDLNSAEGSANNAIAIELLDDLERCRVFRPLIDHLEGDVEGGVMFHWTTRIATVFIVS